MEIIVFLIAIIIIIIVNIILEIGNIFINISVFVRNIKFKVKSKYLDLITVDREINIKYSPAVLSYLYNYKLEPKKDILATVLNLYNKKIIDIKKNEDEYDFIPCENMDLSKLTEDEKYIFYSIVSNQIKDFSPDVWKKIVIDEYNEKFRIYKIYKKITVKQMLISIFIITFFVTLFWQNLILEGLMGLPMDDPDVNMFIRICLFIFIGILYSIPVGMFVVLISERILPSFQLLKKKLNPMEKEELLKWMKFENFIKKYTLLSERKIEEVVLFEKYIPYAMVLNVNKEYENRDIQDFVRYYMKNVKRNIKSYMDIELNNKINQKYTFK